MLDLEKVAVSEVSVLELKDAKGEPMMVTIGDGEGATEVPATVTVYGPGSEQYQKAQLKAQRRIMHLAKSKGAKALDARTPEERRKDLAETLADMTVGFEHITYKGLQGRALAVGIYQDPRLGFIVEQVNAHAGDWANFTNPAQTA